MKQRILFLVAALALAGVGSAFGSGTSETTKDDLPWETVTVTGKVSFKDMPFPELTAGTKVYELMVPRLDVSTLGVKSGDTVTVVGVPVDNPRTSDGRQALRVTKATINGKEYVVPAFGRGGTDGRMGPGRGGPMNRSDSGGGRGRR